MMFSIEGHGLRAERKSRHLYDLYKMMGHDFAAESIADDTLWESIRHHREIYTSVSGMDYTPDVRERLVLVPREDIIDAWKTDYEHMMSSMIYGEKPSWAELMEAMRSTEHTGGRRPKADYLFGMDMDLLLCRGILALEMLKNGALGEKE